MKAMLIGAGTLIVLVAIGGFAVIEFGLFDSRADTPHYPPVGWAVHTTMINATARGARGVAAPRTFTSAEVTAGLKLYDANCTGCHGGPAIPRAAWTNGMNPSPPYLLDAARHWTPGELFWIVRNGIKMTGMPAWEATLSDGQVWEVVAFLEAMPALSPREYARLRTTSLPPADPTSPTGLP